MILTVTPNPSLDRTVLVGSFARGSVHRTLDVRLDPGGKGVNVARAVTAAGRSALALLPSGGLAGTRVAELLAGERVPAAEVPIAAATRTNVAIVEGDGTTSKFNEPGPRLTGAENAALRARAAELTSPGEWVLTCGSLPEGCPDDLHARIVDSARAAGARVAVDTSGQPLDHACRAAPDLVKPNLAELRELAGRALHRLGEVCEVAGQLRRSGVGTVLVSLGEHGALLVEEGGAWHARGPVEAVRSTVGAGDAMMAGFLLGGAGGPAALRDAVAYGAAAVGLAGSRMPVPTDLRTDAVRVDEVDDAMSLTGAAA